VNGLGRSGDFERNGYISIMHGPSARKSKTDKTGISCVLPKCTHIDHTEHELDVIVTEQSLADIRGLGHVERAKLIIEKCAHLSYKDQLLDYLKLAQKITQGRGARHEPQILSKVYKMRENFEKNGTMHLNSW
jgi:acetyl-CoA hydrolase